MFFVFHGNVYHIGADGVCHVLDTQGFDNPGQWIWQVLPRDVFEHMKQMYQSEQYRGPG